MRLNAKQVAQYTGGRFLIEAIDPSEILNGITWDSREVQPGMLFVALVGEKVDGHNFVEDAIRSGARAILVNESPNEKACRMAQEFGVSLIEVPNTYHAISDLAKAWRSHLNGCVIGITGSAGKTTTKNLVRDVLKTKFSVVATKANQNNELGVPNTILSADPQTEMIVVEMGMRGLGQISQLCDIARPDFGLITNIGVTHMELLGSVDNIARAKAELFEALPVGSGVAFVNDDDEKADFIREVSHLRSRGITQIHYSSNGRDKDIAGVKGTSAEFDAASASASAGIDDVSSDHGEMGAWAENVSLDSQGCPCFELCSNIIPRSDDENVKVEPTLFDIDPDIKKSSVHMSLGGEHNVINACAAASVGLFVGIPIADVARALSDSVPEAGRAQTLEALCGARIIDDSYNASPDSMRASLKMFSAMEIPGKKIAVLGDMGELGDIEVDCHIGVGQAAANSHLDELICVGDLSKHIASGAKEAGMAESSIIWAPNIGEALSYLESNISKDDALLVKASHFMELNRIVEGLMR